MSTYRILSVAALVAVIACASRSEAQVYWQGGNAGFGAGGQSTGFYLPGYWQLSQESTANEIELTDDQKKELKTISDEFREHQQELYKPLQNRELTPEQRSKISQELRGKHTEIQQALAEKVKQVLLPHQLQWLEEIDQRRRILSMVQYDAYLQRLDLSDKQLEKLRKSRERLQKAIADAQREMYDDAVRILTPEQKEKLLEPYRAAAQPQATRKE